jgi:GNAT superfamily N-acetyltransferase
MIIRPATSLDVPRVLELSAGIFNESHYPQVCKYDPEKVAHLVNQMIAQPDEYFLYVAEKDGTIIGMYAGLLTEYYFSQDRMAVDLALFVDPKRRGGIAAIKLVQAFEDWAFEHGAKEICPATSTQVAPERTAQLYHLLGYEVVGNLFKKRR